MNFLESSLLSLFAKKTKKTHAQQKAEKRKRKRLPDTGSNKSNRGIKDHGGGRRGGKQSSYSLCNNSNIEFD